MVVDEEIYIDTVTFSSLRLIYIFHFDLTPGGVGQRENHCVTGKGGIWGTGGLWSKEELKGNGGRMQGTNDTNDRYKEEEEENRSER